MHPSTKCLSWPSAAIGRAAEAWSKQSAQAADSPQFWRNLATIRSFLGNYAGAIEALQKYAALNVPADDAIDAEALAQLFSKTPAKRKSMRSLSPI